MVGIVEALREAGVRQVERAVVLGAGGTAQAALEAFACSGRARPPCWCATRPAPRSCRPRPTGWCASADSDGLPPAPLPEADVVISTLPSGVADAYTDTGWAPGTVVMDVVYDPWPTPLAASALAAGCRVANGLDVLLHQAVDQVTLMTGRPGPVEAMRAALDATLRARG